jgi:hypothetical protein
MSMQQQARAPDEVFGGTLPHNIEAEQCLLGALLLNNDALTTIDSPSFSISRERKENGECRHHPHCEMSQLNSLTDLRATS